MKEEFIEGQYYIAKKDTWFIEGTKCLYVEHLYDDRGIFEGKIKLENTTTKSWWNEHIIGDIIHDREACGYDEFINQNKDDQIEDELTDLLLKNIKKESK
tara:strand:- start:43 stop:342 length:300 start_codon:yes stop_codon:yes gene_type:complete